MSQINLWSMCTLAFGDLEKILHLEEEGTFCLLKKSYTANKKESKLKYLRTNNGLEFLSKKFTAFCKSKGVTRHLTVRGTPQQNGVAERMNRRLLERVRCMLLNAGLSKGF